MIEFGALLGFILVNSAVKLNFPFFYAQTMCATTSLCLAFILFGRVFLHIAVDRVWRANTRHFLVCVIYFALLLEGMCALYYFSNDSRTWQCYLIQVFVYSLSTVMFFFVKVANFKSAKLYGSYFLVYQIIDCVLIGYLMYFDITATPEKIGERSIYRVIVILVLLAILNILISSFKTYWIHKKTLLSKFDTQIKNNKIKKILIEPTTIKDNGTIREIAYVLDNALFRVIEANLIVKQLHDLLELNGWSTQEATELCGDFSSILIKTLMKRKFDFCLLPRPIVKLLQTYGKRKDNKRTFTLSI